MIAQGSHQLRSHQLHSPGVVQQLFETILKLVWQALFRGVRGVNVLLTGTSAGAQSLLQPNLLLCSLAEPSPKKAGVRHSGHPRNV
jgi:hypothetical protein